MGWNCSYSVILKDGTLKPIYRTNCYIAWITRLSELDKVIVHIPMSSPENESNNQCTNYTDKQLIRYFRALQKGGLQFTFSGKNPLKITVYADFYSKAPPRDVEVMCYNIECDLTKCSHMNAQVVMHCMRFLYEKYRDEISKAFFRFLDDKKSRVSVFNKMLLAMLASPGSGHSFGTNGGYNILLTREQFKQHITSNTAINPITSTQLPKIGIDGSMYATAPIGRVTITNAIKAGASFEDTLKLYNIECAKYT